MKKNILNIKVEQALTGVVPGASSPHNRNQYGFKDTSDCYRTINGSRYLGSLGSLSWYAAVKKAGLRYRRINDEIFIHQDDIDAAAALLTAAKEEGE